VLWILRFAGLRLAAVYSGLAMPQFSPNQTPIGVGWVLAGALALLIAAVFLLAPSWTCAPFRLGDLADPGELPPPLPPDCVSTTEEPSAATVQPLETQREQMGLILKETVTCKVPASRAHRLDPQWLQRMYVGGALRYRRHVLLAATQEVRGGTLFTVERCLMPWWKYINESGTSCWGQLEFWK
jgi:hypothetical protein